MGDILKVSALSFGYGRHRVLDNIRFFARSGSFFIILGPNGSGKTTLLKLVAGLLPAPMATVFLKNRDIGEYSARELALLTSYVPQHHHQNFPFRLFDFVLMGRAPHLGFMGQAGNDDRRRVAEALAFTDLSAKSDCLLPTLSGGEGQRALVAKAICQDTPLVLLDEPTASLDLGHQVRLMDLLNDLCRQGRCSVVMVSHDLNLASRYADQILLLSDGQVAAHGPPGEVFKRDILEAIYQCRLQVETDTAAGRPSIHLA
jgi:iron complex transport system ATP-binding protein